MTKNARYYYFDNIEIDYLEERGGRLFGYEIKRQGEMRPATRREFNQAYPNAELGTVTMDNFEAFLRE